MMYHTWGWVVGNPFRPKSSLSPLPKWTPPKNDKYFVSAQNSCLLCHYSSNTLISEIFIKIREGAFRDVPCKTKIKVRQIKIFSLILKREVSDPLLSDFKKKFQRNRISALSASQVETHINTFIESSI